MNNANSKLNVRPSDAESPEPAARAVPTFIATDLLEKLIADRDALAVRRVVTAGRRH